MKEYRTRRNLLHKAQLGEFVAWALDNGYRAHPTSPKAVYEVARLELCDPSGSHPHVVIYERLSGDHLTLCGDGVRLVQRWMKSKVRAVA